MLGHKDRDQSELFITGTLRQLLPDDHILVRVDVYSTWHGCGPRSLTSTARTTGGPVSIRRPRCG